MKRRGGGGGDNRRLDSSGSGFEGALWKPLGAPPHELRLEVTLENGQVFSWEQVRQGVWEGVLQDRVILIRETSEDVVYCVAPPFGSSSGAMVFHTYLRQYFNLHNVNLSLEKITREWNQREPRRLGPICTNHLKGLRLLRQDPFECTIAFICSSNNNIKRIKLMLSNLRRTYGKPVQRSGGTILHQFPTVESLSNATEERLRKLGFGYRAKYIVQTARLIKDKGGHAWLEGLRENEPDYVREALLELPGVGPKVADCVSLFCLDQHTCVPVDTHVWQLVEREFKHVIAGAKTLTKRVYGEISKFFLEKFGPYCGWAHSFLFAAELPNFRSRLPEELQPPQSPRPKKMPKKTTKNQKETAKKSHINKKPKNLNSAKKAHIREAGKAKSKKTKEKRKNEVKAAGRPKGKASVTTRNRQQKSVLKRKHSLEPKSSVIVKKTRKLEKVKIRQRRNLRESETSVAKSSIDSENHRNSQDMSRNLRRIKRALFKAGMKHESEAHMSHKQC